MYSFYTYSRADGKILFLRGREPSRGLSVLEEHHIAGLQPLVGSVLFSEALYSRAVLQNDHTSSQPV